MQTESDPIARMKRVREVIAENGRLLRTLRVDSNGHPMQAGQAPAKQETSTPPAHAEA